MDTRFLSKLVGAEEKEKNHLDNDLKLWLTPQMKRMFANPPECINPFDTSSVGAVTYKKIQPKEIITRQITQEEYNKMPDDSKKSASHINYGLIAVLGILTVVLLICLFKNLSVLSGSEKFIMAFTCLVFTGGIIWSVRTSADSTIRPDSLIAEGTTIFFTSKRTTGDNSVIKYFVSVALHDQQSYVSQISCSKRDYYKMKLDSKVYILVKGNNITAHPAE